MKHEQPRRRPDRSGAALPQREARGRHLAAGGDAGADHARGKLNEAERTRQRGEP